jgi:polysaccharide export outer membrane protein
MTQSSFSKLIPLCFLVALLAASLAGQTNADTDPAGRQLPVLKDPESRRYKLNPGDVLEVAYRYTPEFNQTVTVHPDGHVVLQIAGDLKIAGLTLPEARSLILTKASERLKDPEMTLLLKEFQKPYYVVSGEVNKPGRFEMDEQITALQAVLLAGGFNDQAKTSKVVVFRKINKDFAKVTVLDLKGIRKTSDLENDMSLETGDIVFIPRNRFSKFEKFIRLTSIASILNPIIR